jgi:hypothetical protein
MSTSVIQQLRRIVPRRPLTPDEAQRVAELQATKLILLTGKGHESAIPTAVITDLPRVRVLELPGYFASGSTRWKAGAWQITLNASDAPTRRRFSLGHEFKHALDHPFIGFLYPSIGFLSSRDRAEQAADHFAACLWMPAVRVRQHWDAGLRDARLLARLFGVSPAAMRVRLTVLGYLPGACRHDQRAA